MRLVGAVDRGGRGSRRDPCLARGLDLRCTSNVRDCSPTRDCSATRDCSPVGDCNPHWDCPDCGFLDAPCHARRVGCELDKQRYRSQCEIDKTARKADCERLKAMEKLACETEKELERLDCERLKAMEITGCQINQAWLDQWGEYEIGRLEGNANVSPLARACILGIRVTPDLGNVEVPMTISASSPVAAELKFTPYDLANLLCLGQWQGVLAAQARVPEREQTISAEIRTENAGDRLHLRLSSSPMTFQGEIAPPPLAALTAQNPSFRIACAPLVGAARIAGWIDADNDPFKTNQFELAVPAQTFSITIEPFRVEAEELSLVMAPSVTPKSLMFTLR